MNEGNIGVGCPIEGMCLGGCSEQVQQEFQHLRSDWWWLFLLGALLMICGLVALIFPALTSLAAVKVLGVVLIIAGIATVIAAFWSGKWSGLLVQLLVGILYLAVGFMITEKPLQSIMALTLFMAAFFMVAGGFRFVAALMIRFPYWGWSLLNGIITFLLGLIIYRNLPQSAIWILGLLVGLELFFHGWTWMAISLAIKKIPAKA